MSAQFKIFAGHFCEIFNSIIYWQGANKAAEKKIEECAGVNFTQVTEIQL